MLSTPTTRNVGGRQRPRAAHVSGGITLKNVMIATVSAVPAEAVGSSVTPTEH